MWCDLFDDVWSFEHGRMLCFRIVFRIRCRALGGKAFAFDSKDAGFAWMFGVRQKDGSVIECMHAALVKILLRMSKKVFSS